MNATLRDSLNLIEMNHLGAIFVVDQAGSVIGLATDGDIRRHLIQGGSLTDSISLCTNTDYIWEKPEASRELLIKKPCLIAEHGPLFGFLINLISKLNS